MIIIHFAKVPVNLHGFAFDHLNYLPYFLEISPHLLGWFQETPPSKSRRMEKGRRIPSTRNAGARARA